MGWELIPSGSRAGKAQMYQFYRTWPDSGMRTQTQMLAIRNSSLPYIKGINVGHWSWQAGTLWMENYDKTYAQQMAGGYTGYNEGENAIRYINDTDVPFIFKTLRIATVACNSGGQPFWAWGQQLSGNSAKGWGGGYYCYVRVTNDNGLTYTASDHFEAIVPDLTRSNMDRPGSAPGTGSNSAQFAESPSWPPECRLQLREFPIEDCPIIEPGGSAYIHLAASYINGSIYESVMKFNMNADAVEVEIEPAVVNTVWQFQSDHQWHLIPDWHTHIGNKWMNNK